MGTKIMINLCIIFLASLTTVSTQGRFNSVPSPDGTFHAIPRTSFTCQNRAAGYYADIETGCQIYHMCDGLGRQFSYACPNTTLFQQRMLVCDHWYMVNCSRAEKNYDANLLIGQKDKPFVQEGEFNIRTPRPDILEKSFPTGLIDENFRKSYKVNNQQSVQNSLNELNNKPLSKDVSLSKSQHPIESSSPKSADAYQQPGQYSLNFIRNLANGGSQSQPNDFVLSQLEKFNDRRNVKQEGNFGSNEEDTKEQAGSSVTFTTSGLNSKASPTPVSVPSFTSSARPTQSTRPIQQTQPSTRIPSSFQPPIEKPSIYFIPPKTHPIYSSTQFISNTQEDSTDSPSEKVFSTEKSFSQPPPPRPTQLTHSIATGRAFVSQPKQQQVLSQTIKDQTTSFHRTTTAQQPQLQPQQQLLPPRTSINNGNSQIQSEEKDSTINEPSIFFEPPVKFPLFDPKSTTQSDSSTDSPLKITFTTENNAITQSTTTTTPKPFTDLNSWGGSLNVPRQINGIQINSGSGFKLNNVNAIPGFNSNVNKPISSQSIPANSLDENVNIVEPAIDLLPPHKQFKTYDDSTTIGPLVYYEWKWAVPAFDLEPPVPLDSEISSNLSPPVINSNNPFTPTTENTNQVNSPTARSLIQSLQTNNNNSNKINATVSSKPATSTEDSDYVKLRKEFSIPEFDFPLETAQAGQFDEHEHVNSFQIKLPDDERTEKPFYGENPECPDCHPAFLAPGTCEPCIKLR